MKQSIKSHSSAGADWTVIFDSRLKPNESDKKTGDSVLKWGNSSNVREKQQSLGGLFNFNTNVDSDDYQTLLDSNDQVPIFPQTPIGGTSSNSDNTTSFGWEQLQKFQTKGFYLIISWSEANKYMPTQYDGVINTYNTKDGWINLSDSFPYDIVVNPTNKSGPYTTLGNNPFLCYTSSVPDETGKEWTSNPEGPTILSQSTRGYPSMPWRKWEETNAGTAGKKEPSICDGDIGLGKWSISNMIVTAREII